MLRRALLAFLPLAVLVAIPLLLRPPPERTAQADLALVIVSPHNQGIRDEFGRAFSAYWQRTRGQSVFIDWRTPGGTSDMVRYVDDQYGIAFQRHWVAKYGADAWTKTVAESFNNAWVKADDEQAPEEARRARAEFLASDVGIGLDLMFGGGQFDLAKQADKGHGVDAGLLRLHPEWFTDAVIPQKFSGEVFYDPQGRYYGACLAAFGVCYNRDRVALLPDPRPPERWTDLGEPRFFRQTAIADPTKSGSINKCFEMLLQQQMQEAVAAAPPLAAGATPDAQKAAQAAALDAGWAAGLNLIKRIGGNARYFTDSASKVPHDVGRGDTVVGMCIDFYGRSEADWTGTQSGRERVVYQMPAGGSSLSADPIMLLRGAPHRELAVAFIEFVLSAEGQKLWNYRAGEPGGPVRYALRRLPVRRDLYSAEHRAHMSDAGEDPYAAAASFVYHGGWTGPHFNLIRVVVKTMVLDPAPELTAAWGAIVAAGGPAAVPAAMAEFERLPFAYHEARDAGKRLQGGEDAPLRALETQRAWSEFFRASYQRAAALARAGQ